MKRCTVLPTLHDPDGAFLLRPFASGDILALMREINESQIACRVTNVPSPYTFAHACDWLARLELERLTGFPSRIDFVIEVGGVLVGSIAFIEIRGHRAQLSFWLGVSARGRGIMTRATRLLVQFGQDECGFLRIFGHTATDNFASQYVLKNAGFEFEGVIPGEWMRDGELINSRAYGIVKNPREK